MTYRQKASALVADAYSSPCAFSSRISIMDQKLGDIYLNLLSQAFAVIIKRGGGESKMTGTNYCYSKTAALQDLVQSS